MRDGIVVAAPCKINTHLRVLDRRIDGFHDIESVFQALSFGDTLAFESLKECFVCDVLMDGPVPPEHNIVHKAVSVFRRETGFDGGVRISIDKKIPFGAGLGGGSSDAAATLNALTELSGLSVSRPRLDAMAAELGSDVVFFLHGGSALVYGRGEIVVPIDSFIGYTVLLVHPGFSSDTAFAYRSLDQARESGSLRAGPEIRAAALTAASQGSPAEWPFYNDFLPVLRKLQPDYEAVLDSLRDAGACYAGLSGSGSVCFGVFLDSNQVLAAEKVLKCRWAFVQSAVPLARTGKAVLE